MTSNELDDSSPAESSSTNEDQEDEEEDEFEIKTAEGEL